MDVDLNGYPIIHIYIISTTGVKCCVENKKWFPVLYLSVVQRSIQKFVL